MRLSVETETSISLGLSAPPLLTRSKAGDVRIGPIKALPTVLSELGVPPQRAFRNSGVDPG
ncbi:MAG: hypothetical protein WBG92_00930, partial [Thiohalocapsa sp.]